MSDGNRNKSMKLLWCSPHPNHYNGYLFDHLAALPGVSFTAVYFTKGLLKYPWKSSVEANYPVYYLRKTAGVDVSFLWRKLWLKQELPVIAGWNEPTMLVLLLWYALTGQRFILYSDTPRVRVVAGLKEWIRKTILTILFKKVYRFLVTGIPGVEKARLLGIKAERIINFPFATNTDFFIPSVNVKSASQPLVFVSSGRLDNAHKGYDVAINAFAKLRQQHPEHSFVYWIAGEGPDRKAIEQQIESLGMTEHVVLKGWLEPLELLAFYHGGDVFLHPSHEDPFPNAVLEAMACGLPVIGSDAAGSVKDRVKEGINGFLHGDGDIEELKDKLMQVLVLSATRRIEMGQAARATALNWTVSYHTNSIQEIVSQVG